MNALFYRTLNATLAEIGVEFLRNARTGYYQVEFARPLIEPGEIRGHGKGNMLLTQDPKESAIAVLGIIPGDDPEYQCGDLRCPRHGSSVAFYQKLGFELVYGGECAEFSSLKAGAAYVNLAASPEYEHRWWGRAIFRVDHVDALHRALQAQGLTPELPRDAFWGERFFHVTDPDGHELSFAELVPTGS